MPRKEEPETPEERMLADLLQRIRRRTVRGGREVLWLDLRSRRWAYLGRITLRDPTDDDWPEGGETTDSLKVAEAWLKSHYVGLVGRRLRVARQGGVFATVEDVALTFLESLREELGRDHNSYIGRRGHIRKHIIPALGSRLLAEMDHDTVRDWVMALEVEDHRGKRPAALETRKGILGTLGAVWEHYSHSHGQAPPWGKIKLGDTAAERAELARQLRDGERPENKEQPLDMDEAAEALTAAWQRDQEVWSSGPAAAVSIPYGSIAMALILCTGARITESTWVRWKDVFPDDGIILIPGAKSHASYAHVPLQGVLRGWLDYARELHTERLGRAPTPEDLILQNDISGYRDEPMSRHTLRPIIDKALKKAGLKIEGRSAHALRKTFSTTAEAQGISPTRVKRLLRHSTVMGGVTDKYVKGLAKNIKPHEREIMAFLPTPESLLGGVGE